MSDQLRKNLTGQYAFLTEADRLATLKNIKLGGAAVAVTITTGAGTINAALGCLFTAATVANTTFTITNLKDGQVIKLVTTNSGGAHTVTLTGVTGTIAASGSSGVDSFTIFNAGGTIYVTQDVITA